MVLEFVRMLLHIAVLCGVYQYSALQELKHLDQLEEAEANEHFFY